MFLMFFTLSNSVNDIRNNRSYSFSEDSLKQIQTRTVELSRSLRLSDVLRDVQSKSDLVASRAAKEGLQPSLLVLLGLALTRGGESGTTMRRVFPKVALFGSFGGSVGASSFISFAWSGTR